MHPEIVIGVIYIKLSVALIKDESYKVYNIFAKTKSSDKIVDKDGNRIEAYDNVNLATPLEMDIEESLYNDDLYLVSHVK